jgi:GNAT superfamily N-acetyltransferase
VTPDRWDDLVALFGDNGAYANCWCMWWRTTAAQFDEGIKGRGAGNREAMKSLVSEGRVPGLLAYKGGEPVGWVSVAPRSEFGRVERSPILKPVDDEAAWAIVCFYIDKRHRGEGVGKALLDAAVKHVAKKGGRLVEGYPVHPDGKTAAASAYTGVVSMFENAGFDQVARRKPTSRSIWRKRV